VTKKHLLRALHRPQFRRDAGDEQLEGLIRPPTVTKRHPLNTFVLASQRSVAMSFNSSGAVYDPKVLALSETPAPRNRSNTSSNMSIGSRNPLTHRALRVVPGFRVSGLVYSRIHAHWAKSSFV
jgi:hypothetical protein